MPLAPATPLLSKRTSVRYSIVAMLFVVSTVNYADRATLSITGTSIAADLHLDPVAMGYVFSAFGWAYVLGQLPGGWLLDRFGSKLIYGLSLLTWSLFTFLQGFVAQLGLSTAGIIVLLFTLRFLVGLAEAPSFPANGRIVAAWFPTAERGTASAIFNSSQYFALVIFSPIMGSLVHRFGWPHVYWVMGGLGLVLGIVWFRVIHTPTDHPRVNEAELEHIRSGGGLVALDQRSRSRQSAGPIWNHLRELLRN